MDIREILSKCDHTLLSPAARWGEVSAVCADGLKYGTASVCIPPCFVKQAKETFGSDLTVCTVIGFPHGNSTSAVKCFEAADAVKNGADEIDMVINIGMLKEGRVGAVLDEINAVKDSCGDKLLKVIVETCLLTEEEKLRVCAVVSASRAEYIKTSTGFSTGGATKEDIALFAAHVTGGTKIKAAGGIRTLEDAAAFLELGASRLGTSRIVSLAKAQGL